jgi:hypothetical protein
VAPVFVGVGKGALRAFFADQELLTFGLRENSLKERR